MTLKYYCDSFTATYIDKYGKRVTTMKLVYSEMYRSETKGRVCVKVPNDNAQERIAWAKKTLERESYTNVQYSGTAMVFNTFNDFID